MVRSQKRLLFLMVLEKGVELQNSRVGSDLLTSNTMNNMGLCVQTRIHVIKHDIITKFTNRKDKLPIGKHTTNEKCGWYTRNRSEREPNTVITTLWEEGK